MSESNKKINNFLAGIKNNFILKQIFADFEENKWLNIIRYNKIIQNRLNIDIKYYKKIYLQIKIEIFPSKNRKGLFINIPEKKESYFNIFFSGKEGKQKQNYIDKGDKIKKIIVKIDYGIKSLNKLFKDCICIKKVNFVRFNRKDPIKNMSHMFSGCTNIEEINFTKFKTDYVTDMSSMFNGCLSLKKINLSNFNTNNVTDMNSMFCCCSSLRKINLSNFNTDKVTNMMSMFYGCSSLIELNLSNFNTNKVENMSWMFYNCSSLIELEIPNFNINKETDINYIFYGCSLGKEICSYYS